MTPNSAIECTNLTVRFGDYTALEDVSLVLASGQVMAIIGPNGAGKSVFIQVLLGLIEPTAGEVRVLGNAPRQVPPLEIGYVPQVKTLKPRFPALPIELVATGLEARWPWRISEDAEIKAMAALEQVGVAHLARRPIQALSGGERQRVYLARSLVRRPKLLLLDEPATGIDFIGEADLYHILEHYQAQSRATIVIVTHDWSVAEHHADQVLLLNRKRIALGPPAEALQEESLRAVFGHHGHTHVMLTGAASDD